MAGGGRVLCVGLTCLDIVNVCETYPVEDTDSRVVSQEWRRGGNASNSGTVLAILGAQAECMCTIANSPDKQFLLADFHANGVAIDNCIYHENCATPTSIIILNQQNGSRTILHNNRTLPEVSFGDFESVKLSQNYKWIHFEGRPNVSDIKAMLQRVDAFNACSDTHTITTSVELEKTRFKTSIDGLLPSADYVFLGKEYAVGSLGARDMYEAVDLASRRSRQGATVICAWGTAGAVAKSPDGSVHSSRAFPPEQVVDTLGAGDTFIGATIYALGNGQTISEALTFGCRAAGSKCGMGGFSGLKDWHTKFINSQMLDP